jgi:putative transposase
LTTLWAADHSGGTGILPVTSYEQDNTDMEPSELTTYRRKLPHWRMQGSVYFVTWRLAKTQPALHPEEKTLVVAAIRHFDGLRYELIAYVVMDDHVHVLMLPLPNYPLHQILHSWKSFTSKGLRRLWKRDVPVWQDEYFDRIVRNDADLI